MSKFVKTGDAVSDDRNWIGTIKNELKCAELWEKDWGFLAGDSELKVENATKLYTVDDRIKAVQEELEKIENVKVWTKTSTDYGGQKDDVELFKETKGIKRDRGLLALDRKLPKGWKKEKWKPPVDEFDPLRKK